MYLIFLADEKIVSKMSIFYFLRACQTGDGSSDMIKMLPGAIKAPGRVLRRIGAQPVRSG
jgi:hypothetical protein